MLAELERLPAVVIVAGHQDLKKVTGSLSSILSIHAMHLRIPSLREHEQGMWQSRIDEHFQACGCGQALVGTAFLLGIFGAYRWLDPLQQSWSGWETFLTCFGIAAAGAGLGKIVGLLQARLRLRQTLLELEKALSPTA